MHLDFSARLRSVDVIQQESAGGDRTLPKYLHLEPTNATYYLRHSRVASRANLGKDREQAIATAQAIVRRFRYEAELEACRLVIDVNAPAMQDALPPFARSYVESRRLKASNARLIEQRTARIVVALSFDPHGRTASHARGEFAAQTIPCA